MKRTHIVVGGALVIAALAGGAFFLNKFFSKGASEEKLTLTCSGDYSYRSVVTGDRVSVNASTIFLLDFKNKEYVSRDGGVGFVLYNGGTFSEGSEVINFSTNDKDWFKINRVTGVFTFGKESPFSPDLETNIICKKSESASF